MKIQILASAYADLRKGRLFYDAQAENLGDYFFDTLFSDIDSLMLHGGVHQKVFGYHRMLSSRFPYAIYYKLGENGNIVVWRVLDCRQEPKKTKQQLTDEVS